jgi:hypothetical protein
MATERLRTRAARLLPRNVRKVPTPLYLPLREFDDKSGKQSRGSRRPLPGGRMSFAGRPSARRLEIATGGKPLEVYVAAIRRTIPRGPAVWSLAISHDDGCPTLTGHGMEACTCEVVWIEPRKGRVSIAGGGSGADARRTESFQPAPVIFLPPSFRGWQGAPASPRAPLKEGVQELSYDLSAGGR